MNTNLLDVLVIVIVGASVAAGVVSGFARSGIALLCAILGVLCGFWFYQIPAVLLHTWIRSQPISNVLGFLLIFFAFVGIGAFAGRWVMRFFHRLHKWTGLGWLDRAAGAVFGLVRGALAATALVAVLLAFTPRPIPNWMVNSTMLPYAVTASSKLANLAPTELTNAFRATVREMREIWVAQLQKSKQEIEAMKTRQDEKIHMRKDRRR